VAGLVVFVGCGQADTGVAESGIGATVTSGALTPEDRDAGTRADEGESASTGGLEELASGEVMAIIDDPDGYTNVRAGEGTDHDVVTTVREGEVFYVIPQGGDQNWWPVRTASGHSGFMHRSRIDLVEN
jgi:hypothetical protein